MLALKRIVKSVLTTLVPRTQWLTRGPRACQQVALTFDDGPDADETPRVLDELAELGIPATFFVIGTRAARQPALIRRIVAEGHALGNHSWDHSLPSAVSAAQLVVEVDRCRRLLFDLTGQQVSLFRPPCGKLTGTKLLAMWGARQTVVLWTTDPHDSRMHSYAEADTWARQYKPFSGEVVLLHDDLHYARRVLPEINHRVRTADLEFCTLNAWLPQSAPSQIVTQPEPETVGALSQVAFSGQRMSS